MEKTTVKISSDTIRILGRHGAYQEVKFFHTLCEESVICEHCGQVYDFGQVEDKKEYHDCTDFTTPCCKHEHADTRTHLGSKHFVTIGGFIATHLTNKAYFSIDTDLMGKNKSIDALIKT